MIPDGHYSVHIRSPDKESKMPIPLFYTTIPYHSKKNQKTTIYQSHTGKSSTLATCVFSIVLHSKPHFTRCVTSTCSTDLQALP